MDTKRLLQSPPDTDDNGREEPPGKHRFPAFYYKIDISRERQRYSVLRRYSQFQWLYHQIVHYTPPQPSLLPHEEEERVGGTTSLEPLKFPPKTCPWQVQDDDFAQNRMEELRDFLSDALKRPFVASHPAVKQFLKLRDADYNAQNSNGHS